MRRSIILYALFVLAGGCHGGEVPHPLQPLARGLTDAMQPSYSVLRMEIVAHNDGDRITLHCALRNVSIAATPIELEPSSLPWRNPDLFQIDAVTASGKVVHRNQGPMELGPAEALPSPLTLTPGNAIEGDLFLNEKSGGLPTNDDLLLLWWTSIHVLKTATATELRGVTYLQGTSATPGRQAGSTAEEMPRTVSGTSMTSDEPWFNPPGGTWTPETAIVSEMKTALDATLREYFAERGTLAPPVHYWFQYLGHGSGDYRTIDIRGRPLPVFPHADTQPYFGPYIPEDCIVHGRYIPSQQRIENLVVGGFCPARL